MGFYATTVENEKAAIFPRVPVSAYPRSNSVTSGLRFYIPSIGRWLNRDPIEEWGGDLLYNFLANNSINYADLHGLLHLEGDTYGSWDFDPTLTPSPAPQGVADAGVKVVIKFNPATICKCDYIAFLQIVKITKEGKPYEKRDQYKYRIADGWVVDTGQDTPSPWYGHGAGDKVLPDPDSGLPLVEPGRGDPNKKSAILRDHPRGRNFEDWGTKWEFVTCSACKKGENSNKIYSCISWGFQIFDKTTKPPGGGVDLLGVTFSSVPPSCFQPALDAWNRQAEGPLGESNTPGAGRNNQDRIDVLPIQEPPKATV